MVRFWRDDPAETRIRWYRVGWDTPCLPVPHIFDDPLQLDLAKGAIREPPNAGVLTDNVGGHNGAPPVWRGEGRFCGSPEAWAGGGRRGIDPPLVWSWDGRSSCCRGRDMAGTHDRIMRWGPDGATAVDSRGLDTGAGYVVWDGAQRAPFFAFDCRTEAPSADDDLSQIWFSGDGFGWVTYPDGSVERLGFEAVAYHELAADPHPVYTTPERAVDAVNAALDDTPSVFWQYDDAADLLTASVRVQHSLTVDASGLHLVGDVAAPGPGKVYGTNAAGAKGWQTAAGLTGVGVIADDIPRFGVGATTLVPSPLRYLSGGAVRLGSAAFGTGFLNLWSATTAGFTSNVFADSVAGFPATTLQAAHSGGGYNQAFLRLLSFGAGAALMLEQDTPTGMLPQYGLNGNLAPYISSGGWDVRGGLVFGVPTIPTVPSDAADAEAAQDAVGAALLDTPSIDLTYDDAAGKISGVVRVQQSVKSDAGGIGLVGDVASPGGSSYYGTNPAGARGYYPLPGSSWNTATLPGNVTVSSTLFGGSGLAVTIPSAGTYLLCVDLVGQINMSAGVGYILCKLRNLTAGADIPNSYRLVVYSNAPVGSWTLNSLSFTLPATFSGASSVEVWVARAGGGTFTGSLVVISGEYYSTLSFVRLA